MHPYLHDSTNLATSGRVGSQYARNAQRSKFAHTRMPMPPKKKIEDRIVSRLMGKRKTLSRRFHSSLALRFCAGDMGVPNKWAEAVTAMSPATARTTPINWTTKMFATTRFYQRQTRILTVDGGAVPSVRVLGYKVQGKMPDRSCQKAAVLDFICSPVFNMKTFLTTKYTKVTKERSP